jgi:hypothetical protein
MYFEWHTVYSWFQLSLKTNFTKVVKQKAIKTVKNACFQVLKSKNNWLLFLWKEYYIDLNFFFLQNLVLNLEFAYNYASICS